MNRVWRVRWIVLVLFLSFSFFFKWRMFIGIEKWSMKVLSLFNWFWLERSGREYFWWSDFFFLIMEKRKREMERENGEIYSRWCGCSSDVKMMWLFFVLFMMGVMWWGVDLVFCIFWFFVFDVVNKFCIFLFLNYYG